MVKQQPQIIGKSQALKAVLKNADRVAPTKYSVLILGETGTGKELLARYVHDHSDRAGKPFVAVNCAAIPKDLLESELFGHERGAFTGASQTREGAFEQADGGTLFLDEIGDLAPEHQPKLLRVLQQREVRRVGAAKDLHVDVRIVAATRHDLRAEGSTFREDLYFRLAGDELTLPPLRERDGDVVDIAKAILARLPSPKALSREAQGLLLKHDWPGNVRDLENVVARAALHADGQCITGRNLRPHLNLKSSEVAPEDRLPAVLAFLKTHGRITAADVRELFQVQRTHACRLLQGWVNAGELVLEGRVRGAHYVGKGADVQVQVPARLQVALRLVEGRACVTRQEYELEAGVSARTAKRDLAELVKQGRLRPVGSGKATAYLPP